MKLILIRHGATTANEEGRYAGARTNEPLSEKGRNEIKGAAEKGIYPPADILIASPMKRCMETAKLIYKRAPDILIEDWKEIDFGSFEGKTYKELSGSRDYQKWIDSDGSLPFPGGESKEEFLNRCRTGFLLFCKKMEELIGDGEGNPECAAAAVVHGGTIMAVLSTFGEGEYYGFQCGNGEGYICQLSIEEPPHIGQIRKL